MSLLNQDIEFMSFSRMKNTILFGSAFAAMLLLMPAVSAIQDSYMYVSLSYGRGWWGWACVTEQGQKGVYGSHENFCGARGCPFEQEAMFGVMCLSNDFPECAKYINDELEYGKCIFKAQDFGGRMIWPPAWGLVVKITIPEDLKVVNSEGTVVSDSVCLGDTLHVEKGVNKGEWWNDGGHEDSPPIYWVDDVVNLMKELMGYHDSHKTTHEEVFDQKKPEEGWVDPLVNAPVYTFPVTLNYGAGSHEKTFVTGNMLCSLTKKSSGIFDEDDNYKVDDTHGETLDLFYLYDVLCTFYYHGGSGGYTSLQGLKEDDYVTFRVPTVIQAGPHATYLDWGTHNVKYSSAEDFFKVGEARLQKTVSVVRPVSPELGITVPGAESMDLTEANIVRVLVENKGDVDVDLLDVSSNAAYDFIACDAKTVKPGETKECLLSIAPKTGEGVSVQVNYKYKSCGIFHKATANKEITSSKVVSASSIAEAYSLGISGGCENQYYVCGAATDVGFSLGYKCQTKEPNFLVSSTERINLEYQMPALEENRKVSKARLILGASLANSPQEVSAYLIPQTPAVFCVPGGDICARPYCQECKPLYNAPGEKIASAQITGPGEYTLDVTDEVVNAYMKGQKTLSFQLRGKEDYPATEASCGAGKDWIRYDLNFRGKADAPYLEIVYAK